MIAVIMVLPRPVGLAVSGNDALIDAPGHQDRQVVIIGEDRAQARLLATAQQWQPGSEGAPPRRADPRCGRDGLGSAVERVGGTGPAWRRPERPRGRDPSPWWPRAAAQWPGLLTWSLCPVGNSVL